MAPNSFRPAMTGTIQALGLGRYYHNYWWDRRSRKKSPWTDWARRHGVVFIHIPKNAGTSVYSTFGMDVPANTHCPVAGVLAVDADAFRAAYSFGFVRNPWDRIVSAFHYLKHKPISEDDKRWAAENLTEFETFEAFIAGMEKSSFRNRVLMWRHFKPQWHFLSDWSGKDAVSFIGRFESLEADIATIGAAIGITPELTRENVTKTADYSTYFTPAARDLVARIYAEDIARYGYAYEDGGCQPSD